MTFSKICLKSVLLEKTAKWVWDSHNKHIENQRGFRLKEQFQLMNHKLRTKQNQALTGVTQLEHDAVHQKGGGFNS